MKPKIFTSRCFFQPVRYNGEIINNDFVNRLKEYVEFIDFCPEIEIGLGVPRERIIILLDGDTKRLIQPETGKEFTEDMVRCVKKTVSSIKKIDGFILKAKSPSCGVGSALIYKNGFVIGKTYGFLAEGIKKRFPELPLEDEKRLNDIQKRRHFLIRSFAFAELRYFLEKPDPHGLVKIHSRYKCLLMTYNKKLLKELGKIVEDKEITFKEKINQYKNKFYKAFSRKPSIKRHLNTLKGLIDYLSERLTVKEKEHLFNLMNQCNNGRIDLKIIIELLRSFAYRFEDDYMLNQKYLFPYPVDLDS